MNFSNPIIVTGAAGYVGSAFLRTLLRENINQKIFALDRVDLSPGFPRYIRKFRSWRQLILLISAVLDYWVILPEDYFFPKPVS